MDPEQWPKDPTAAAALVALVLDDLVSFEKVDLDHVLAGFLRTAWPSRRAQCQ